jgi:hypothetical protein
MFSWEYKKIQIRVFFVIFWNYIFFVSCNYTLLQLHITIQKVINEIRKINTMA